MLYEQLQAEARKVEAIKQAAEKSLRHSPCGSLRITRRNGWPQFYQRVVNGAGVVETVYLGKKRGGLVRSLAQKDYDRLILKSATTQQKAIDAALKKLSDYSPGDEPSEDQVKQQNLDLAPIKQIYADLCDERKELVVPYELPDDMFAELWEQEALARLPHDDFYTHNLIYRTEKGHLVRSKSEAIIADRLLYAGVPYIYELPFELTSRNSARPDFTVLNKRTREEFIWEHFGLMDDPDYRETAFEKLALYAKSGRVPGRGLIVTFESVDHPLDIDSVTANIEAHLQ